MTNELSYESKKDDPCFITENEHAFCILNFEPLNDGHVMVLPKRFVRELDELTPQEAGDVLLLCGNMQRVLNSLFEDKAAIIQNCASWRTQPHAHIHILPFNAGLRHMYRTVDTGDEGIRHRISVPEQQRLSQRLASVFGQDY